MLLVVLSGLPAVRAETPGELWDTEPYRIRATLAIDAPGHLAEQLSAELPQSLDERTTASIGRVWHLETQVAAGPLRHRVLRQIESLDEHDVAEESPADDKRVFVSVVASPWGYELSAREYDRYTRQWGKTLRTTTRQRDALGEELFALVRRTVAPLARLQPVPDDPQHMRLSMRAGALRAKAVDFRWAEPGDVFQPLLRRATRDGALLDDGVQLVPWTYLEIEADTATEAGQLVGRVRSGMQQPLGLRRRARTEEIAIALRTDPAETTLALRSRIEREKPLSGYEVEAQDVGAEESRLVGVSGEDGEVQVQPGKTAIQMVSISSAGTLLARFPIVPGAEPRLEIPLPDDSVRLQAAAKLAALREDLIDAVARRNIFIARVRKRIEEKDYEAAQQLLESLDALPGRTRFNQALERESRALRSKDPQIQRRIDQLFAATQLVLGQFLDPRPIGELHNELRQARQRERESSAGRADAQLSTR